MRALVTGAAGFAGQHLCALLQREKADVAAVVRPNLVLPELENAQVIACDLSAPDSLQPILDAFCPEHIYLLGSVTTVAEALADPRLCINTTLNSLLACLEWARRQKHPVRILNVSSAHVYAPSTERLSEDSPLTSDTPYSATKLISEQLSAAYALSYGIHVVTVRPFTHIGPGQSPRFASSEFARQLAAIMLGEAPPVLTTGSLEVFRDLSDVRDVVEGYWRALTHSDPGSIYNICSGHACSMREFVQILVASTGRKDIEIRTDPQRVRLRDTQVLWGDATKANNELNWSCRIDLQTTAKDMLDYWLSKGRREVPCGSTRTSSLGRQ